MLWLSCGEGWGPEEAWRRMRKGYVCGMERSPEQVSRAQRLRGIPDILEFKSWDGQTVVWNGRPFDHVISCAALVTSPRPADLLREIHRVLIPGGSLWLVETTARPPLSSARELLAMLVDTGFTEAACTDGGGGSLIGSATRPQGQPEA